MIQTPQGKTSAKYSTGRTWKRHMRTEKIARLCAAGTYTNEQIANSMGVTLATIIAIKQTKEFHAKMLELTSGVISEYDKDLRENVDNQIEELASMVPMALLGLRNALLSKNENIRLKAASEVLDRDGKLAKVSKVNVQHEEKPDLDSVNRISSDIMALLSRTHASHAPTNEQNNTIDAFTVSAADASGQVKMMNDAIDEIALANIQIKGKAN